MLIRMHAADAQPSSSVSNAAPPSAAATRPGIAVQADRLLKQMSAYLGSAGQFTFHADITLDHVLPTGQKLEYAAAEDVALQPRPRRLYVERSADLGDRRFWYDGSSVTLLDPVTAFYAAEAAPGGRAVPWPAARIASISAMGGPACEKS